jgi:hypothetical protein
MTTIVGYIPAKVSIMHSFIDYINLKHICLIFIKTFSFVTLESMLSNERDNTCYLGHVFNFKLGSFALWR